MPIQEFPTLSRADANPKLALAIRILREKAQGQESQIVNLDPRIEELEKRPYPLTIEQIKELVQFTGGPSAINVTGLLGILAQPQPAGIPLLSAFPSVTAADNGLLVNIDGILYYYDARFTDPGTWVQIPANAPEFLGADRTYYVRTDGSDSNSGLADNAAGAWLTVQHAIDTVTSTLSLGGFNVTIQVRTGTFAPFSLKSFAASSGRVIITGDTGTPANVVINNATAATHCITHNTGVRSNWKIEGLKLTNSGAGNSDGINMSDSRLEIGVMEFGAITRYGIVVATAGQCTSTGDITWSGNLQRGVFTQLAGVFAEAGSGHTWTYSGAPAWGTSFAYAASLGLIAVFATQSGAATGKRFTAELNAVIQTFGGGVNFFPGNVAGTTATGAQYN